MREFIFIALVAIITAFPGRVEATQQNYTLEQFQTLMAPITDNETVGRVISYLVIVHNYDTAILYEKYQKGEMTIEKGQVVGYDVTIVEQGSGTIISILENL